MEKIAHEMWVHGSSVAIQDPGVIEWAYRTGKATHIKGKPHSSVWLHFAIPTPVIIDGNRLRVGKVLLRFKTEGYHYIDHYQAHNWANEVHVWDGDNKFALWDKEKIKPSDDFELPALMGISQVLHSLRLRIDGEIRLEWGLNGCLNVYFDSFEPRTMQLIGAGAGFYL